MGQGGIRLPCGFFLRPRRQQEGQGGVLQENELVTSCNPRRYLPVNGYISVSLGKLSLIMFKSVGWHGICEFPGGVSPRRTTVFPIISPAWPVFFWGGGLASKISLNWWKMIAAQLPQMGDLVGFYLYGFIGVNYDRLHGGEMGKVKFMISLTINGVSWFP